MAVATSRKEHIVYPESDGKPMADNTKQFRWIVTLEGGFEALFREREDVFVAGDLLWYPVEGRPDIRMAPDVMIVFGRPKGDRGSYKQWEEGNIPPQVVFEVLSPGNTLLEMAKKLEFYDRYGVEEYYLYDPDSGDFTGWIRGEDGRLQAIDPIEGWTSPRLGVRFEKEDGDLRVVRPDGQRFLTYLEVEQERQRAQQQAEQERQRAEKLAQRLRELGIDPEQI
ncbi:MAG: Uma2 family endonuclease [Armatimonadota bacterium]|nr:Uma2 family endonuclease [bacterium]MDW8320400.1 Uma2 family endonuclease [Armatimonadota bacterium]